MTAPSPAHLSPSSIAHSAERASRASTWMRSGHGRPGGCIRPDSRIAIRSCTHSKGRRGRAGPEEPRPAAIARARGEELAKGQVLRRIGRGMARDSSPRPRTPPQRSDALGRPSEARTVPPPATRESSAATRLTTFMFYFVLIPRLTGRESMPRLGAPSISSTKRRISRTAARVPWREMAKPMWLQRISTALSRVSSVPARRRDGDEPVPARPDRQRRHRRLGQRCRESADRRPCGRRPARRAARRWSAGEGRPTPAMPSVTTARTRSGSTRASSRAKSPPRLQPTTSIGCLAPHRSTARLQPLDRVACARRGSSPAATDGPGSPPRRAPGAIPSSSGRWR